MHDEHTSHSAPKCVDCWHSLELATSRHLMCQHPVAPVDLVSGLARMTCERMRHADPKYHYDLEGRSGCGPSGALFVSADRVGHPADLNRQVIQAPGNVVLNDVAVHVGGTGGDEGAHQIGMSGGIASPE